MKTILSMCVAIALACFCQDAFAQQCPNSGGGGGGGSFRSFSESGGRQGGSQGQLLTGPGSYFHDLMVQNYQRQVYMRQQAAIVAAKQAKKNTRRGKQLETRRAQREAELARREAKKRAAAMQQNLNGSNQVRLASANR